MVSATRVQHLVTLWCIVQASSQDAVELVQHKLSPATANGQACATGPAYFKQANSYTFKSVCPAGYTAGLPYVSYQNEQSGCCQACTDGNCEGGGCANGYYKKKGKCKACATGCATCGTGDQNNCKSCLDGYLLDADPSLKNPKGQCQKASYQEFTSGSGCAANGCQAIVDTGTCSTAATLNGSPWGGELADGNWNQNYPTGCYRGENDREGTASSERYLFNPASGQASCSDTNRCVCKCQDATTPSTPAPTHANCKPSECYKGKKQNWKKLCKKWKCSSCPECTDS